MIDAYDILHYARKAKNESQMKGERNDTALVLMGVCTAFIGATMITRSMGRSR
ncbi:hypothetical protein ACYOEI_05405 [Singulisphaera rosea]